MIFYLFLSLIIKISNKNPGYFLALITIIMNIFVLVLTLPGIEKLSFYLIKEELYIYILSIRIVNNIF